MTKKRYTILAKRKNTNKPWSEWTTVDNYHRAEHHASRVEKLGFLVQIKNDPQVEELWAILGGGNQAIEQTDAILDAGFCKCEAVAREIILEIDLLICCHANGDIDSRTLYVLFDELKKKYFAGEQTNET